MVKTRFQFIDNISFLYLPYEIARENILEPDRSELLEYKKIREGWNVYFNFFFLILEVMLKVTYNTIYCFQRSLLN